MNRFGSRAGSQTIASSNKSISIPSESGVAVAVTTRGTTPSTLFGPMHYEPNYAYPLVVWLHGRGQTERQLIKVMPLVSVRNYVAVAPRGPVDVAAPRSLAARSVEKRPAFSWSERSSDLAEAEQRVFEAIDEARGKYRIGARRIFLAGVDVGGTVALRLALMHAEQFAGVASLGGSFPQGDTPLARLKPARRLPIFLAHGRDDEAFAEAEFADQLRLFHAAGMNVTIRQYPGGAGLATQMPSDMNCWLMDIVTGAAVG